MTMTSVLWMTVTMTKPWKSSSWPTFNPSSDSTIPQSCNPRTDNTQVTEVLTNVIGVNSGMCECVISVQWMYHTHQLASSRSVLSVEWIPLSALIDWYQHHVASMEHAAVECASMSTDRIYTKTTINCTCLNVLSMWNINDLGRAEVNKRATMRTQ